MASIYSCMAAALAIRYTNSSTATMSQALESLPLAIATTVNDLS
ncbi:hypothetical protein [Paenibacillus sp. NPDC057934]